LKFSFLFVFFPPTKLSNENEEGKIDQLNELVGRDMKREKEKNKINL